jgi:hypothetical protein
MMGGGSEAVLAPVVGRLEVPDPEAAGGKGNCLMMPTVEGVLGDGVFWWKEMVSGCNGSGND